MTGQTAFFFIISLVMVGISSTAILVYESDDIDKRLGAIWFLLGAIFVMLLAILTELLEIAK